MRKRIYTILLSMLVIATAQGQRLVDVTFSGSLPEVLIELQAGFPVDNGVVYYTMTYATTGVDGLPDTASGLLVLPDLTDLENLPMVISQHPTSQSPVDVPTGGFFGIGFFETVGYGAYGHIAFSPDYLGLGTSRGFHPFVHARTEAQQGLHMLEAVQEYLDTRDDLGWDETNLFVAGYSQGGHASMALHRLLQEEHAGQYDVTAAAHMSGPYSMGTVMLERFLSFEPVTNVADPVYMMLGYNEVEGVYDSLTQIFKPNYASRIELFYNRQINLNTLAQSLREELVAEFDSTVMRFMFQDSIIAELENPDSPLRQLISENDTYDWAPQDPTYLIYCGMDERIPAENSILADSVMKANGSDMVTAVNISAEQDHVGCFQFAVLAALGFFDTNQINTSIKKLVDNSLIDIYPNPAYDQVDINLNESNLSDARIRVIDVRGKILLEAPIENGLLKYTIDVSTFTSGMYVVQVSDQSKVSTKTLMIQR